MKVLSYLSNLSITRLFAPLDVHYNNILNSDAQKQYQKRNLKQKLLTR